MFNINAWELLIIAALALLILGPERLPEFLARAGRLLNQARRAADEATAEISREMRAITEMAEAQMEEATRPGQPPRRSLNQAAEPAGAPADPAVVDEAPEGPGAEAAAPGAAAEQPGTSPSSEEANSIAPPGIVPGETSRGPDADLDNGSGRDAAA